MGGRKEGERRGGVLEFLSYEQFPVISSGRKIKPSLLAVSIPKRLSQRMLEEVSLGSPLGPEPLHRAPAEEAWEGRRGQSCRSLPLLPTPLGLGARLHAAADCGRPTAQASRGPGPAREARVRGSCDSPGGGEWRERGGQRTYSRSKRARA